MHARAAAPSRIAKLAATVLAAAHLQAMALNAEPAIASTIDTAGRHLDSSSTMTATLRTVSANEESSNVVTLRDDVGNEKPDAKDEDHGYEINTMSDRELEDMTRRNTRVSGRASQQFAQARRLAEQGDTDGALSAYGELIDVAPSFAPAYSNRANLLVVKGQLEDAVKDYSRAIELAPKDGDTWVLFLNRGSTRLALGENPRVALEDLNAAYSRKGPDPLVLANRAAAYEALGKWESALRDYQNALKGNDVKPFWLRYGLVLFERGKSTEAIGILKRVLNSFKVDDVRAALAAVFFENGDIASAETMWNEMDRPRQFESRAFLESRKWPPRAVSAMDNFRSLRQ